MQIFCPKCNTKAYDDTSFFCHKCGMQLPVHIREKEKDRPQTHGRIVPDSESIYIQDDSLRSPEPALIDPVKPEPPYVRDDSKVLPKPSATHPANPVEICAQCGGPIIDKSRIFCKMCGANIREELSGGVSSIVKYPVPDTLKSPAAYQNPQIETTKEQDAVLIEETHISPISKNKWRLIAVIVGIVLLFFIYLLILLQIYLAEFNHTIPAPP